MEIGYYSETTKAMAFQPLRMSILVFSWRDPRHPLAGGAEQVMHEHMKGWVEAGHEVTLFASRFNNSKKREVLDGVEIVRGGYQYLGVQMAGFWYYFKNRKKIDFLVDQFHGLPFMTPLYSNKPKLAVIQEPARRVWFLNPLTKPINWIVGLIGYLGEPMVFLFYRKVKFMTGSESAKEDVSRWGIKKKNIYVIPHGVIVEKPRVMPKREGKKTVVFLGIHSKDKGIEDAIACFNLLNKKGEYNFWTIGKFETAEYKKRVMRMIDENNLKGKIKFWGFVSQREKFELLARAHILINPSVHEGWGLVNIEANAMGTPVVAYPSRGLVDSVKDGVSGILCEKSIPEAMATGVLDLLSEEKKYKRLQRGAVEWSERFSWERSKRMSLKLIERMSY